MRGPRMRERAAGGSMSGDGPTACAGAGASVAVADAAR